MQIDNRRPQSPRFTENFMPESLRMAVLVNPVAGMPHVANMAHSITSLRDLFLPHQVLCRADCGAFQAIPDASIFHAAGVTKEHRAPDNVVNNLDWLNTYLTEDKLFPDHPAGNTET